MNGHTEVSDPLAEKPTRETEESWRVKCHLRQYFWMCYSIDKDISLRSGHPPAIPDDYCNLTLPISYSADTSGLHVNSLGRPFLPGDLRVAVIKSKALQRLYSAQALKKSDAELLRDIRELDDELEEWRLSLHPRFRPTLSSRAADCTIDPNVNMSQKMHYIITNFEYHYLMATIHQATSRCRSWDKGESGEVDGVSSSLALSVEASRATLIYLRTAVCVLASEAFW